MRICSENDSFTILFFFLHPLDSGLDKFLIHNSHLIKSFSHKLNREIIRIHYLSVNINCIIKSFNETGKVYRAHIPYELSTNTQIFVMHFAIYYMTAYIYI